ncbi:MAG: ParB/RepB/Spo0J family partition protein [bacterium]|nr:ParB/RepB/Spo0J family partition protein [bacterium]
MDNVDNEIKYLYLDDIIPNRFQPRENFDEQALKELAVSIKEHGVIQPIIVRQIGEKYEIIAGERRYKASTLAGLTKIPAIVRNLDDKETSKVALLENLQRRDLTAIEEARTYQKILELDALTQEELAKTMGKSQSAVSNKLRLLSLTDEVQDALLHEQISERHARSLLNITDPIKQVELLNKVITSRMTVRELDQEIKGMNASNNNENVNISTISNNLFNDQLHNNDLNEPSNVTSFINEPVLSNSLNSNNNIIGNINEPIISSEISESNQQSNKINEEEIIGGSGLLAGMTVGETILQPKSESNSQNNINLENNLYKNFDLPSVPVQESDTIEELDQNSSNISPLFNSINQKDIDQRNNSNNDTKNTVNEIKSSIDKLKQSGKKIDVEEFDFDDFYQIVVRIDK